MLCTCSAQDSNICVSNLTLCRAGPSVNQLKPGWSESRMLLLADTPPETAVNTLQLSDTSLAPIQQLGGSCLEDQADPMLLSPATSKSLVQLSCFSTNAAQQSHDGSALTATAVPTSQRSMPSAHRLEHPCVAAAKLGSKGRRCMRNRLWEELSISARGVIMTRMSA